MVSQVEASTDFVSARENATGCRIDHFFGTLGLPRVLRGFLMGELGGNLEGRDRVFIF